MHADPPCSSGRWRTCRERRDRSAEASRSASTPAPSTARVALHVVDRGPGIPPAERERVFEPFQRLGDAGEATGVGLGLAVARGFVEAIGGELELDDTPGGGLTIVAPTCRAAT